MKTREDYNALVESRSAIDLARMAAFIDGEGSIFIGAGKNLRGRQRTPQHRLQLVISNTNVVLVNWLKQTFDGSVYFVKYENCKHLGKKQIMRWQINERMAAVLLSHCLPYIIVKKPQAEVALAFMELKRKKQTEFKPSQITASEFDVREGLAMEVRRLNKSNGSDLVQ